MEILIALFAGVIFSIGLILSGMTNPDKVIGFLDIFGSWDYSLVFVMVGAILTSGLLFNYIVKRKPFVGDKHFLPTAKDLDKKIIIGSAMFGIGWGLAGICPGPGIVNIVTGQIQVIIFIVSLVVGMLLYKITQRLYK